MLKDSRANTPGHRKLARTVLKVVLLNLVLWMRALGYQKKVKFAPSRLANSKFSPEAGRPTARPFGRG